MQGYSPARPVCVITDINLPLHMPLVTTALWRPNVHHTGRAASDTGTAEISSVERCRCFPAVSTALNSTSTDRLVACDDFIVPTPMETTTVIRPTRPLPQVVTFKTSVMIAKTIPLARAAYVVHIEKLQKDLNESHKFWHSTTISVVHDPSPHKTGPLIMCPLRFLSSDLF